MTATEPIAEFSAFVARVQTMADGSPRITLDISEDRTDLLTTLANTRRDSVMLSVLVFDAEEWEKYKESITKVQ
jgi:hypothetical protein